MVSDDCSFLPPNTQPSHDERFFKYTLEITVQGLRIIDDNQWLY